MKISKNIPRRIISILLTIMMLMGLVSTGTINVIAASGNIVASGSGSVDLTYESTSKNAIKVTINVYDSKTAATPTNSIVLSDYKSGTDLNFNVKPEAGKLIAELSDSTVSNTTLSDNKIINKTDASTLAWTSGQTNCKFTIDNITQARTISIRFDSVLNPISRELDFGENKLDWARSVESSIYGLQNNNAFNYISNLNLSDVDKHLPLIMSDTWDKGKNFYSYKDNTDGVTKAFSNKMAAAIPWASWQHTLVNDKTSIRRFTTSIIIDDINNFETVTFGTSKDDRDALVLASGGKSYPANEIAINDNIYVMIQNSKYPDGIVAMMGGTNIENSKTITRNGVTITGIKAPGQDKSRYPFTDGWYITTTDAKANIKQYLVNGLNTIYIFSDEYRDGGGMISPCIIATADKNLTYKLSSNIVTYVTDTQTGADKIDTANNSGNGGSTAKPTNDQTKFAPISIQLGLFMETTQIANSGYEFLGWDIYKYSDSTNLNNGKKMYDINPQNCNTYGLTFVESRTPEQGNPNIKMRTNYHVVAKYRKLDGATLKVVKSIFDFNNDRINTDPYHTEYALDIFKNVGGTYTKLTNNGSFITDMDSISIRNIDNASTGTGTTYYIVETGVKDWNDNPLEDAAGNALEQRAMTATIGGAPQTITALSGSELTAFLAANYGDVNILANAKINNLKVYKLNLTAQKYSIVTVENKEIKYNGLLRVYKILNDYQGNKITNPQVSFEIKNTPNATSPTTKSILNNDSFIEFPFLVTGNGTQHKVSEININSNYEFVNWDSSRHAVINTGNLGQAVAGTTDFVYSIIKDSNRIYCVDAINKEKGPQGSIEITKTVAGTDGVPAALDLSGEKFAVKVTLGNVSAADINSYFDSITVAGVTDIVKNKANKTIEFNMTAGSTAILSKLPNGTYEIEEVSTGKYSYTAVYEELSGSYTKSSTVSDKIICELGITGTDAKRNGKFNITNALDTGSVEITKTVADGKDWNAAGFTFNIYRFNGTGDPLSAAFPDSWVNLNLPKNAVKTSNIISWDNLPYGSYVVVETDVNGYKSTPKHITLNSAAVSTDIVNTADGTISVTKSISQNNVWPENGFTFELYKKSGSSYVKIANSAKNATSDLPIVSWTGLAHGDYRVVEVSVSGYSAVLANGWAYDAEIGAYKDVALNGVSANSELSVKNEQENVSITVTKKWKGDFDNKYATRKAVSYEIKRSSSQESLNTVKSGTIALADFVNGTYTTEAFSFPKFDKKGNLYTYSVSETSNNSDYDVTYESGGTAYSLIINNTLKTKDIKITKVWNDDNNKNNIRPATLDVFLNGAKTTSVSNWVYTFTVPASAVITTADISETVPAGYELVNITGSGSSFTITNKLVTASITGTKKWSEAVDSAIIDKLGLRPAKIEIKLNRNNVYNKTVEFAVTSAADLTLTISDLPGYFNNNGTVTKAVYSIEEVKVNGYTISQIGNTITNTLDTVSLSIEKLWKDGDNLAARKDVTFKILNGTAELTSGTLTANGNWKYSTTLPKYDKNGSEIDYNVAEITVDGYKQGVISKNHQNNAFTFTITNTITGTTSLEGKKTFTNDTDFTNIAERPASITIELWRKTASTQDDQVTASTKVINVNALTNEYEYSFIGLDKYDGNGDEYSYFVKEQAVKNYTTSYNGNDIVNDLKLTSIKVTKTWDDANDKNLKRPASVIINLIRNGNPTPYRTLELKEGKWEASFDKLPKTDKNGVDYVYTIEEVKVENYNKGVITTITGGFNVTNKLDTGKTSHSGTKIWIDNGNAYGTRHDSASSYITINLMRSTDGINWEQFKALKLITAGTDYTVNPSNSGIWNYSFTNLPMYSDSFEKYTYMAEEVLPNGSPYVQSAEGNNITNRLTGKTALTGKKTWVDSNNEYNTRSDITVKLMKSTDGANWTETGLSKPIAAGASGAQLEYSFSNLEKYDDAGVLIQYKVTETGMTDDYTLTTESQTDSNGDITCNLTNKLKTVDITVNKIWSDNGYTVLRKTTAVQLYQDNIPMIGKSATVNTTDGLVVKFTDLPKYKSDGVTAYVYTIAETRVNGYKNPTYSRIEDTIIVTNELDTINLTGTKAWSFGSGETQNRYNPLPDSITVTLKQNGNMFKTQQTSSALNWAYSFQNIPKTDENGNAYSYTVTDDVNGFIFSAVSGAVSGENGIYNILNTRDTINLSGTKSWIFGEGENIEDIYGTMPASVEIRLYQNDAYLASTTAAAADGWIYSFTNLPKTDLNGNAYTYKVSDSLKNFDVSSISEPVTGETGIYDITNTLKTLELSGVKSWIDNNAIYPTRPETIKVELYRDGSKIGEQTISSDDNAAYSFTNLPVCDKDGNNYSYTVKDSVGGYIFSTASDAVTGTDGTYNITNSLDMIDVTVQKIWLDNDIPDERVDITFNLKQDNGSIASYTMKTTDSLTYTFEDLPKAYVNTDGEIIDHVYTVEESIAAGAKYVAKSAAPEAVKDTDGNYSFTFENVLTDAIDISVVKIWEDDENASNNRPLSVSFDLICNNDIIDTITLDSSNSWRADKTGYAKYDSNGALNIYTIEETTASALYAAPVYSSELIEGILTLTAKNTLDFASTKYAISMTKIWDDADNIKSTRPNSIPVILTRNDSEYWSGNLAIDTNGTLGDDKGSYSLTTVNENSWSIVISNLPMYDDANIRYTYAISEGIVDGYNNGEAAPVAAGENGSLTVTNVRNAAAAVDITLKKFIDGQLNLLSQSEFVCSHTHDETCILPASECLHEHDDVCGYSEGREAVEAVEAKEAVMGWLCGAEETAGDEEAGIPAHNHTDLGCIYDIIEQAVEAVEAVEAIPATPCTHTHDAICGHAEMKPDGSCIHEHDETCKTFSTNNQSYTFTFELRNGENVLEIKTVTLNTENYENWAESVVFTVDSGIYGESGAALSIVETEIPTGWSTADNTVDVIINKFGDITYPVTDGGQEEFFSITNSFMAPPIPQFSFTKQTFNSRLGEGIFQNPSNVNAFYFTLEGEGVHRDIIIPASAFISGSASVTVKLPELRGVEYTTLTLTELETGKPADWAYDTTPRAVKVELKDGIVTVSGDELVFSNIHNEIFIPEISITKNVENKGNTELVAGSFSFEIIYDDNSSETVIINTTADESVKSYVSGAYKLSKENYTGSVIVKEVRSGAEFWSYDPAVYMFTVDKGVITGSRIFDAKENEYIAYESLTGCVFSNIYDKTLYTLTINYVNEAGTSIRATEVRTYVRGAEYTVDTVNRISYLSATYLYSRDSEDSDKRTGVMDSNKVVTLIYVIEQETPPSPPVVPTTEPTTPAPTTPAPTTEPTTPVPTTQPTAAPTTEAPAEPTTEELIEITTGSLPLATIEIPEEIIITDNLIPREQFIAVDTVQETTAEQTTLEDVTDPSIPLFVNPKTGDTGMVVMISILALSLTVCIILFKKKRTF